MAVGKLEKTGAKGSHTHHRRLNRPVRHLLSAENSKRCNKSVWETVQRIAEGATNLGALVQ